MKIKKLILVLIAFLVLVGCSNKDKKSNIKAYVSEDNKEKVILSKENTMSKNSKFKNIKVNENLTYDLELLSKLKSQSNEGIPIKIKFTGKDGKKRYFEGVKMKLRNGVTLDSLYFTEEDYLKMVKKEAPTMIKEIDGKEKVVFPVEEIAKIYEEINKEYPNFSDMKEADLQMLLKDFPGIEEILTKLNSSDEIISVYQLLSDIYMAQQVYLVNRELINRTPLIQENLKVNAFEAKFGLTEAERRAVLSFANLNFKPFKALAVKKSSEVAKLYSEAWAKELKIGTGDTKADALRHTLWMYELSRMITEQTSYLTFGYHRKNVGIKFAEEFGTAREAKTWKRYEILKKDPNYYGNYRWLDISNRMDLHNNFIGRSYFDELAISTGVKVQLKKVGIIKIPVIVLPKLTVPTTEKVVEGLKEKINNGVFINKMDKTTINEFYREGVNKYGVSKYKGKIIYLQ